MIPVRGTKWVLLVFVYGLVWFALGIILGLLVKV
jgi:hypothetical protein